MYSLYLNLSRHRIMPPSKRINTKIQFIDMGIDLSMMSAAFEGTLVKWGNSVGLALPKPIRDGMGLNAGDKIRIVVEQGRICIQKADHD